MSVTSVQERVGKETAGDEGGTESDEKEGEEEEGGGEEEEAEEADDIDALNRAVLRTWGYRAALDF